MSEENQSTGSSKMLVACDLCGVEASFAKDSWFSRCENKNCTGNGTLVLAPLEENMRYIRYVCICKGEVKYGRAEQNKTIRICGCGREHTITDDVTEIRNNQIIYGTDHKLSITKEFDKVKERLKTSEEEVDKLHEEVRKQEEMHRNERMKLKQLEKDCAKYKEELSTLMEERREEIKEMKKLTEKYEDDQKSFNAVIESMKSRVIALEGMKKADLQKELRNKFLEELLEEKKEEIKEYKEEIKGKNQEIKEKDRQIMDNMEAFRNLAFKRKAVPPIDEEDPKQKKPKADW